MIDISKYRAMGIGKLVGFSVFAFVAILFVVSSFVWLLRPSYDILYSNLEYLAAIQIVEHIESQNIAYEITEEQNGYSVWVDYPKLEELRLKVGDVSSVSETKGFEIFDSIEYSMTDFSQEVNYKRAIQGELSKTISRLKEVKTSRVHITFSNNRLFKSDRVKPKAAIYVQLTAGSSLDKEQVDGIKRLVSNAVKDMDYDDVAVFGPNGVELFSSSNNSFVGDYQEQAYFKESIERNYTNKLLNLLRPSYGTSNISVSVQTFINFDETNIRRQIFDEVENGGRVITKRKEKTLTNPILDDEADEFVKPVSNETEEEFLYGQKFEETRLSAGEVESVHVGIVLSLHADQTELDKVKSLAKATLGINESRGDTIAVESIVPSEVGLPNIKMNSEQLLQNQSQI